MLDRVVDSLADDLQRTLSRGRIGFEQFSGRRSYTDTDGQYTPPKFDVLRKSEIEIEIPD